MKTLIFALLLVPSIAMALDETELDLAEAQLAALTSKYNEQDEHFWNYTVESKVGDPSDERDWRGALHYAVGGFHIDQVNAVFIDDLLDLVYDENNVGYSMEAKVDACGLLSGNEFCTQEQLDDACDYTMGLMDDVETDLEGFVTHCYYSVAGVYEDMTPPAQANLPSFNHIFQ